MRAAIHALVASALTWLAGCDRVFQLDEVTAPPPPDAAIDAAIDGPSPIELVRGIARSDHDAYQDSVKVLVAYNWVSLYGMGLWGGFRFELPEIPRGALIQSASLEMFVDSDGEDTPDVVIATEASSSPAVFETTTTTNISTRQRGLARVEWVAADIGPGFQRSPSVTSLVQERVDHASWQPDTSLVFIFEARAGSTFECRQYDHPPAGTQSMRLHVTFVPPAPPP